VAALLKDEDHHPPDHLPTSILCSAPYAICYESRNPLPNFLFTFREIGAVLEPSAVDAKRSTEKQQTV
jgi:hypothetical protein